MQLKISDMMDNLLPEDEVDRPMKQPDVDTDRVKALVKTRIAPLPSASRSSRSTRKKRGPIQFIAVAAALLLCTGTAFAAAHYFQWDDALRSFLQPTDQQIEDLAPAGTAIGQAVTSVDITVTLNQVLGDKYGVFIVLDVEGPADAVYDDSYSFTDNFLSIVGADGEHFGLGYGYTAIPDAQRPNHFSLIFDLNASESLVGAKASLQLADLRRYSIADMDYIPVTEGDWQFDWALDYTDVSRSRAIDAPFALYDADDRLTELTLSPLSLSFIAQGPGIAAFDQEPDFELPDAGTYLLEQMTFIQNDGTEIPVPFYSSGGSKEGDTLTITYTFGKVMDISSLQSIKIGSEIYPLK